MYFAGQYEKTKSCKDCSLSNQECLATCQVAALCNFHKKIQGIVFCFFKFLRTGRKIAYSYHCGVTERATDRGAGQNKRAALSPLYTLVTLIINRPVKARQFKLQGISLQSNSTMMWRFILIFANILGPTSSRDRAVYQV